MAISASSIASSATLNQLRTQFNNLVTDVTAIEGGSISYTTLNTTTTNATTLNVKEDGTIIFEGATDDGFETTLTVVDPTADRTITFPNETGTVHTTGGDTTHTNIIIADGGNIGSASDTNAIGISSGGVVSITATTANTSATDGALTVGGGLGVAADVSIGDDLRLISDSAVLSFGADSDTTLTHTDGTGLTLNSTNKLTFGDAASFIQQSSNGVLRIDGEATIDMNASTAVTISNDLKLDSDGAVLAFGADSEITLTHVADTGLTLKHASGSDDSAPTLTLQTGDTDIASNDLLGAIQFQAPDEGTGTDAVLVAAGIDAISEGDFSSSSNATRLRFLTASSETASEKMSLSSSGLLTVSGRIITDDTTEATSTTDGSLQTDGGLSVAKDVVAGDDVKLLSDGAVLAFGADGDVTLTHVADTGLLLNGTSQLQFNDASQNITAASATVLDINATDEIELNATLIDVNANLDVSGTYSGGGLMTTGGNIVIPNAGNIGSADDPDAIAIGSDGDVTLTQDLELQHDGAILSFGANDEITLTHVHDTGLLLADSGGTPTLQFHDSNEAVLSDGSNLKLTSGGTTFTIPSSDGSSGQFLKTNGSGVLSFDTVSSAADDITAGDAAVTIATTAGNITVDAQGNDTDIIFKGTDGSSDTTFLTIDGSDAGTLIANHDLELGTDGSIIKFGGDNEITLTHVHDTGLLLEDSGGSPTLQFHDANESVSSDGSNLILTSGGTAFTLPSSDGSSGQALGTNGSGTLSFVNVASAADDLTAGDAAVTLTTTSGNITIDAQGNDTDIILKGTDGSSDTTFLTIDGSEAGEATFNAGIVIADAGTIGSASDKDAIAIGSDGDVTLTQDLELQHDGAILSFGANDEIALTHVHDTGLLLTDSGGSPTLQFHDSAESVSSDGSKLILTSNSVAFSLPTADGSNTQVLQTNGSGVLSFVDAGGNTAFNAFEYTATQGQTSFSGNDDNSNSLSYTAGVNSVQVYVNGILLDSSDYTATNGTAVVLSSGAALNDMIKINAVQSTNVASADLDGAEFVLDEDGDTSLRANTDDQIDIKIANAIDFRMTANNFNVLSGSTLTIDSGATITNSGTANGFGVSVGKVITLAMIFGGN